MDQNSGAMRIVFHPTERHEKDIQQSTIFIHNNPHAHQPFQYFNIILAESVRIQAWNTDCVFQGHVGRKLD